ncbi:unnamed protein product [Didymodactylos carnosus]|uniref:BED-type domain-containing protein n=1 Tax=Didymodactylos carnosus TaxID=1234261 RepID=A0A814P0T8_9BILA|nr:unnamed protein product [Didymodactylos carnosus]CAF3864020.1 unnamed protein product [Didymodactylos carnosus]
MNNPNSPTPLSSTVQTSSLISISPREVTPKEHDVVKIACDKFFTNVTKYEKNWSAQCLLCEEVVFDNLGVTSNVNRHIKNRHKVEYAEWSKELNELDQRQPKLTDFISKKNQSPSSSKQSCPKSCPTSHWKTTRIRQRYYSRFNK